MMVIFKEKNGISYANIDLPLLLPRAVSNKWGRDIKSNINKVLVHHHHMQ